MLTARHDSIITALGSFPDGRATAKQIAESLGWKNTASSQAMGEMFFAGSLDRQNSRHGNEGREFIYWIRTDTPSPKLVAWDGPALVAASRMGETV